MSLNLIILGQRWIAFWVSVGSHLDRGIYAGLRQRRATSGATGFGTEVRERSRPNRASDPHLNGSLALRSSIEPKTRNLASYGAASDAKSGCDFTDGAARGPHPREPLHSFTRQR